eukprot:scaffold22789_cov64-Isochrysis_galbana.AAC.2
MEPLSSFPPRSPPSPPLPPARWPISLVPSSPPPCPPTPPGQAIYGWRGADERNTARLDVDFGLLPPAATPPPQPLPAAAFTSPQALEDTLASLPLLIPKGGGTAPAGGAPDRIPGGAPLGLTPGGAAAGGVVLRLELNYRSRQSILDAAMAVLRPSYAGREAEQLQLINPGSSGGGGGAGGSSGGGG